MHSERITAFGGVTLAADVGGDARAPAVVLLHGGGQTRHAWKAAANALESSGFFVVSLDLRGHGESDWAPDKDYSMEAYAADLRAVLTRIGKPAALVGASLGGLAALTAVGESKEPVATALVLVDITPKIDAEGVEKISGFMLAHPEGFASVEEAADAVSAYLPHRPRPTDVSGLRKNLRQGDDGRYYWHWDPDFLLSGGGPRVPGNEPRLENAARNIRVPTLLVRGSRSEVVSEEGVEHFRKLMPDAEYVDVEGAAHMVAGDKNNAFNQAVIEFLKRVLH